VVSDDILILVDNKFHHRQPSFSICHLTGLELTARNSCFGINSVVIPAPDWELFYLNYPLLISTLLVVSQ